MYIYASRSTFLSTNIISAICIYLDRTSIWRKHCVYFILCVFYYPETSSPSKPSLFLFRLSTTVILLVNRPGAAVPWRALGRTPCPLASATATSTLCITEALVAFSSSTNLCELMQRAPALVPASRIMLSSEATMRDPVISPSVTFFASKHRFSM